MESHKNQQKYKHTRAHTAINVFLFVLFLNYVNNSFEMY